MSFFGDVLLTNSLCLNIKKNYPDSKIVFIVNKPFGEAALFQEGVDEVFEFDKRGKNKGIWQFLKFAYNFPYRNKIYAAFSIYANERAVILSYLLNAQRRISGPRKFNRYFLTDVQENLKNRTYTQDKNADLIFPLIKRPSEIVPVSYMTDGIKTEFTDYIINKYKNKELIGLCCISKNPEKNMPVDTAVEIINKLRKDNKYVLYFGIGKESEDYVQNMRSKGCNDFEDLTNKTTISQMALLLKNCKGLISIDTGTMHLACAVKCPVCAVFYKPQLIKKWAPRKELYKSCVITWNFTPDNIIQSLYKII